MEKLKEVMFFIFWIIILTMVLELIRGAIGMDKGDFAYAYLPVLIYYTVTKE